MEQLSFTFTFKNVIREDFLEDIENFVNWILDDQKLPRINDEQIEQISKQILNNDELFQEFIFGAIYYMYNKGDELDGELVKMVRGLILNC